MESKAKLGDAMKASLDRKGGLASRIKIGSVWEVECRDKDGNLKWREVNHNLCTDEGLNALLDIMFHADTQITTWYIFPFENDHTPAAGNTYATPGCTECTAYDEATRQEFVEAAASGKSLTNSANKATFTISDTKTIYGCALVGGGGAASTKVDTAGGGTLFCLSQFSEGSRNVVDDDTLNVTVTITVADT